MGFLALLSFPHICGVLSPPAASRRSAIGGKKSAYFRRRSPPRAPRRTRKRYLAATVGYVVATRRDRSTWLLTRCSSAARFFGASTAGSVFRSRRAGPVRLCGSAAPNGWLSVSSLCGVVLFQQLGAPGVHPIIGAHVAHGLLAPGRERHRPLHAALLWAGTARGGGGAGRRLLFRWE